MNSSDGHDEAKKKKKSSISIRVDGFPSFYFFSRYNRSHAIEFLQDRSVESLHGFIEEERDRARQWYRATHRSQEESSCHYRQTNEVEDEEEEDEEAVHEEMKKGEEVLGNDFDEMQLLEEEEIIEV